jgi:hypothetical protein
MCITSVDARLSTILAADGSTQSDIFPITHPG